ncbi:MAG: HD domain-containing protein [Candidatus Omnitrophica bacterium]|nr:HD domain-containing protein [Candidatus Omnitrophota bacterium]
MNETGERRLRELFQRLAESRSLRDGISAFESFFHGLTWKLIPPERGDTAGLTKTELVRLTGTPPRGRRISPGDTARIFAAVEKAGSSGKPEGFSYGTGMNGFCCPLMTEGTIFGSILLCGVKEDIPVNMRVLFKAFMDTIIREIRKEAELKELNETIRPRAIALSTVHTVHRLMGSTLDIGELLPRVARLSLQVLRANRCSIKLVDKKRKTLLPMTTVDLREKKAKLKKVEIGKYAPGRAVKNGRIIRMKNYLAVPFIEEEVLGVITLYDKFDGSEFTDYDAEIMKTLAEQAVIAIRNAQLYQEQENLTMASIKCIAMLLQERSHGVRRAEASFLKLINIIGRKFDMNENEIKMMQYAAMLHDTGQISVPERVLLKKGVLTGKEYAAVKAHPSKGATILSGMKPLRPIVPIIRYHHENYDGTGYPRGLKGQDIPLGARILAVISAFEAMITKKPYREALTVEAAVKEVRKNAGTQFDPQVVKVFCAAAAHKNVVKLLEKELGGA